MADIITFEFKGKTYIQDPDKVEQQMKDAGYKGMVFCQNCPLHIAHACSQFDSDENGMWYGEDFKELKASNKKNCSEYGRPEEIEL